MNVSAFDAFRRAAGQVALSKSSYLDGWREAGLTETEWQTFTQNELWTIDQRHKFPSICSEVLNLSLSVAGLPAQPLPAQFVAAIIATMVSPANWIVAANRAPQSYDALDASGIQGSHEVRNVSAEQMVSLVLLYGGSYKDEPTSLGKAEQAVSSDKK